MMRFLTFTLMLAFSAATPASTETAQKALVKLSEQAQVLPLTMNFEQHKYLSGLPRALVSSGEVTITDDEILWRTLKPQSQILRITKQGVFEKSEQTATAGSDTVAELLLAILKQDKELLQQQFVLSLRESCVQMKPRSEVMSNVMQSILSCGAERVERVELNETNGNRTVINFSEAR